jgi:hypothetical protein
VEIPNHGVRYVCDGRNLKVDFALVTGHDGGEALETVMGQLENTEVYHYSRGFLEMRCNLNQTVLTPEGLQPPASTWLQALDLRNVTDTKMSAGVWGLGLRLPAELGAPGMLTQCQVTIDEPVVVVARKEYANLYHTMTDFVGAWSAAVIAGVDPRKVRILFSDGHPMSEFDVVWAKAFSQGRPPLRKKDLVGNGAVCLRRVVFGLYGYASPMTIDWSRENRCEKSPWLASFAKQVLQRYGLDARSPKPFAKESGLVNITLINREDYKAHPRDQGARRSKISNPEALMRVLPKASEGVSARLVQLAYMPFEEQLRLMRNTNVLIGMHGAGLTFAPFLADDAVVIELNHWVQRNHASKFHFQNLAAWSGKGYIRWKNENVENEIDAYFIKVDPKSFQKLVQRALKMVRDMHGSRSFSGNRAQSGGSSVVENLSTFVQPPPASPPSPPSPSPPPFVPSPPLPRPRGGLRTARSMGLVKTVNGYVKTVVNSSG